MSRFSTAAQRLAISFPHSVMSKDTEYTCVSPLTPRKTTDSGRPRAWLVIFGAFTCAFCTVGFMNSFGIFQEYYAKNQLASVSTSTIAWVCAISVLFLFGISVISGGMLDVFGPKVGSHRIVAFDSDDTKHSINSSWSIPGQWGWSSRS